jgi:hypothetical protein
MCILSRADNNEIKARPPSEYEDLMPDGASLDAILESSVATSTLFSDDFYAFRDERADALAAIAGGLIT